MIALANSFSFMSFYFCLHVPVYCLSIVFELVLVDRIVML